MLSDLFLQILTRADIPIPQSILQQCGLAQRDSGLATSELDDLADWGDDASFPIDDQVALEILAEDE